MQTPVLMAHQLTSSDVINPEKKKKGKKLGEMLNVFTSHLVNFTFLPRLAPEFSLEAQKKDILPCILAHPIATGK